MRINHNISALNAYRQLSINNTSLQKSLEKLSSGFRINRAGDDAAGLAISEKMRGQIRGLEQAVRNAQDGISLIQTAEGALNEVHSILQRMRELVVQANNDTNTPADRQAIQQEISQLITEINDIGERTEFNTMKLIKGTLGIQLDISGSANELQNYGVTIDVSGAVSGKTYTFTLIDGGAGTKDTLTLSDGTVSQTLTLNDTSAETSVVSNGTVLNFDKLGIKLTFSSNVDLAKYDGTNSINSKTIVTTGSSAKFQIGANGNQCLAISISDMRATAIGTDSTKTVNTINVTGSDGYTFEQRLQIVDDAIAKVSLERSKLGAYQNRLEHTINNLSTAAENLTAAESRIRDVDMAKEMMEFTKMNILNQAATAMLAQANMMPQSVLKLLG